MKDFQAPPQLGALPKVDILAGRYRGGDPELDPQIAAADEIEAE